MVINVWHNQSVNGTILKVNTKDNILKCTGRKIQDFFRNKNAHCGYRSRPDIESVIHAHPPYATAFAVDNKPIETRAYPEMILLFKKIPLADYGTPSTDEIFYGIEEYVQDYDIILLANHGVIAFGNYAYDAFFKMESAEGIAKVLAIAAQLGGEKELPQNKLEELYELRKKFRVR